MDKNRRALLTTAVATPLALAIPTASLASGPSTKELLEELVSTVIPQGHPDYSVVLSEPLQRLCDLHGIAWAYHWAER